LDNHYVLLFGKEFSRSIVRAIIKNYEAFDANRSVMPKKLGNYVHLVAKDCHQGEALDLTKVIRNDLQIVVGCEQGGLLTHVDGGLSARLHHASSVAKRLTLSSAKAQQSCLAPFVPG
jgi:hypothetical protein